MLWDQGRAEPYRTASASISYTSRTHWAKDFQKPASGWISYPQFETCRSQILIVLGAFESFSGVTKLNAKERSLECCGHARHQQRRKEDRRFEGVDASWLSRSTSWQRCARLCSAVNSDTTLIQASRGPASHRRQLLPYKSLTFRVVGLKKTLQA